MEKEVNESIPKAHLSIDIKLLAVLNVFTAQINENFENSIWKRIHEIDETNAYVNKSNKKKVIINTQIIDKNPITTLNKKPHRKPMWHESFSQYNSIHSW